MSGDNADVADQTVSTEKLDDEALVQTILSRIDEQPVAVSIDDL